MRWEAKGEDSAENINEATLEQRPQHFKQHKVLMRRDEVKGKIQRGGQGVAQEPLAKMN